MTIVVIVDDQPVNLKILRRFALSVEDGLVVEAFDRPQAALAFVRGQSPDLIVTDFVMPQVNGEAFIRHCRAEPALRDVPIIVVTAYEDREYRYRALEAGASDYLLSPVDGQELCTRARNLLTLWRQRQQLAERARFLEGELDAAMRQYAADIAAREEHLRLVINTVPALIRASDVGGRLRFANTFHERYFACDTSRAEGLTKADAFGPVYAERHLALDEQVIASRQALLDIEEAVAATDGRPCVLLTTKAPICGADGRVDEIVTVSLDITQRKQVEQAVRESEERFRRLVEGSVLGLVIEVAGVPVFANRTFARIFGYGGPDEVLVLPSLDRLFAPGDQHRLKRLQATAASEPLADPRELQGIRRDGALIWVEAQSQRVSWGGREALQTTVADVTLRKAYEERLQRQANYDDITGLPNRVLAADRLRSAVVTAVRHRHKGGLLFVDLDQFKKINDTWGHAAGDQLLRMAADRLRSCVREEDTVARLGGDEFTIILPKIQSATHTEPVIHKILAAFSQAFQIGHHEAFVTASIGISVFPDDSEDPAILMQNADAAMYRAKEEGRNTFHFYTPALNERAAERLQIETHLVHALDRGEFRVHYQPIVDIAARRVVGAEALLRWDNPELGAFLPDRFVPLIEDIGLMVPVGQWVLETACAELARWRRLGLPPSRLSVNISFRQLRARGLVDAVAGMLARHQLPAQAIELEITESCLMVDVDETTAVLRALDRLGVGLALDDFGTGYSCLRYLKDLPVDTVKIDKSFIRNVPGDASDASVVEAIIALAHRLGIRVIGEGVETKAQLDFVGDRGCDLAQGYIFAPPLASAAFADWCIGFAAPLQPAL
jgi:diguanylate cyclase (GGDEF)-like protein/PAS domain S-box-containing protein